MIDTYQVGEASCDLEPFNEPNFDMNSSVKWVKNLYVPKEHRKQGLASKLLLQLGKEADLAQVALILECRPYEDNIDAESLERLYKRNGFVVIQDEPKLMTRIPVPPTLFADIAKKKTSNSIITNIYGIKS